LVREVTYIKNVIQYKGQIISMSNHISSVVSEAAENIYKLKLPMPFDPHIINVYLIRENNRLALVDCGLPFSASWETLQAGFAALNIPISDLTDIFLTHWHADHIGALPKLREIAPEARIIFHRFDHQFIHKRQYHREESLSAMREWLTKNGANELLADEMIAFRMDTPELKSRDMLVEGGEEVKLTEEGDGWEIVWTPGHTNGHFVLYNKNRQLLLSGDHLLTDISSNIGKFPDSREDPLGDFLNSLDKLAALDVTNVLPAHGETFNDPLRRITELKEHHKRRLARIVTKLEQGPLTPAEVAHSIWGDKLQGFNRYLGLMEVLSHLERLRLEGLVTSDESDGLIYYRAN